MQPSKFLGLYTALALAVCTCTASAQTTWFVDVNGTPPGVGTQGSPFVSLQAAILSPTTQDGDTLEVAPGLYAELIDFGGKALNVQSAAGPAVTILDGSQSGSVVTAATGEGAGTRLAGFTVRNGSGTDLAGVLVGGGLYVQGAMLAVADCVVETNQAERGAGGYFEGAIVTVDQSTFQDNQLVGFAALCGSVQQKQGGGLAVTGSSIFVFNDLDVLRNTGNGALGAGVSIVDSNGTWTGGLVERNRTDSGACLASGGGLFASAAGIELVQVAFTENNTYQAGTMGGGIAMDSGTLLVRDCSFDGNRAGEEIDSIYDVPGFGGAICSLSGSLTIQFSSFTDNLAWFGGGAIEAGSVDADDCLFTDNTSQFGGAVHGSGTYERCIFRDNTATSPTGSEDFGGAVYGTGGLTLVQCLLEDNRATGPGGAALAADLIQCTLRRNRGTRGGAAISSTLDSCIVRKNHATVSGGALEQCTATGTVLFDNLADFWGGGANQSTLDRCTVYANALSSSAGPSDGGGISGCTVTNSIIWLNLPDQVGSPTFGSSFGPSQVAYSDVGGGFAGLANFDLEPLFWQPLAADFHLQAGSPCIDAGDPNLSDSDGSPLDIGAFPYDPSWCSPAFVFCEAKTSSLGCVPRIIAQGMLDGVQPFTVSAAQILNQKNGLFFYGLNGSAAIPFFGGTLCAKPPLRRTPLQNSGGNGGPEDCSGSFAFDLATWISAGTDPAIGVGSSVIGQFWYRDPADALGTGLTNAFEAVVCQ